MSHSLLRRPPVALFSALVLAGICCSAPRAQIDVVDVNQNPGLTDIDSNPSGFVAVGNAVYFSAYTTEGGRELWITTGASNTSRRLGDINPGPASSNPEDITHVGGQTYFTASRAGEGRELWKLGIRGLPVRVADILPGSLGSSPRELTVVGTDLWFAARGLAGNDELYRLDTTTDSLTRMEIRAGAQGSFPRNIVPFRRGVVCSADDGVHGRELWYATSTGGASLFADIQPGAVGSSPAEIVVTSATVYCAATTIAGGREVWRKGLLGAPDRPFDLWPGAGSSDPRGLVIENGGAFRLYFFADDGRGRRELWEYQPTLNPLPMRRFYTLGRTAPGGTLTMERVEKSFVFQPQNTTWIVFQVRNTRGGRHLLFLERGRTTAQERGPYEGIRDLVVAPTRLYFIEVDSSFSDAIRTFADPSDTSTVTGGFRYPKSSLGLGLNGAYLLVGGETPESDGVELHRILGGLDQSTNLLAELNPGAGTKSSDPQNLTPLPPGSGMPDAVVFSAEVGAQRSPFDPREIAVFSSNGSSGGATELLAGDDLFPADFLSYGDYAWFVASEAATGRELYVTQGTVASTRVVADVRPGATSTEPEHLTPFQGRVFFAPRGSNELWASDGTAAGTVQVDTFATGSAVFAMAALEDRVVLLLDFNGTTELWETDGQPGAANQVVVLTTDRYRPGIAASAGDFVYFCDDARMFATDGTRLGTVQLPVNPGSPVAESFAVRSGALYFIGIDPLSFSSGNGGELWATDGTIAGTRQLVDIAPGTPNAIERGAALVAADDAVYFTADAGSGNGKELYRALAPIALAIRRVTDLDGGAGDGAAGPLGSIGTSRQVAVSGGLNSVGLPDRELWIYDGFTASRLVDLNAGDLGSDPQQFVTSGNRLFFVANDGVAGNELCTMRLAEIEAPNVIRYGAACAASGLPAPRLTAVTNPRYGQTLQLRTEGGAAGQAVFVLLGLFPIEVPLGNGCALLNTGDLAFGGASDGTFADVSLPLPNDPALVGISLYAQMARLAAGGPALGVGDLSDGLRLVVGQR